MQKEFPSRVSLHSFVYKIASRPCTRRARCFYEIRRPSGLFCGCVWYEAWLRSCHFMSRHVMSCHVMSRHGMSRHGMSCNVTACHVLSCHVMSGHVVSCHVMSCHGMACHVRLCHVASCHLCSCDVWSVFWHPVTAFLLLSCYIVVSQGMTNESQGAGSTR